MAANYYPILQAIGSIVTGLDLLDWNSAPLPNAIRKLPKVDENIDNLPLLCIVPPQKDPEKKAIAFGPVYKVTYPVEVVAIAASNRDFTSNLSTYMAWQAAISTAFNTPAMLKGIVPAVWDVNVKLGLVIDRAQVNDNYDYGGLVAEVITSETN